MIDVLLTHIDAPERNALSSNLLVPASVNAITAVFLKQSKLLIFF